jgi:hypothetical protein
MEGERGFLFINNYQRSFRLPERKNFQVELQLPSGAIDVPRRPAMIPSNAYTIWPVNLDLGGATLRYATAQLAAKLDDPATLVFFAWPGIAPEFAFDGTGAESIDAPHAQMTSEAGRVLVDGLKTGTDVAMTIRTPGGKTVTVVLLSRAQARQMWKAELNGKERLLLSPADLWFDREQIHVRSRDAGAMQVGIYPPLAGPVLGFVPSGLAHQVLVEIRRQARDTRPARHRRKTRRNADRLRLGAQLGGALPDRGAEQLRHGD